MTGYRSEDLEGHEFKILRSATGRFGVPERLRAALAEEAEAGWELVEKFDNSRVRLKRKVAWREKDAHLPRDPYRIYAGISENQLGFLVVGIVVGACALAGIVAAIVG